MQKLTKTTAPTNVIVYGDYLSQPVRSIMSFLKINKLPHEFKFLNLIKGEHKTPEFEKINPFKKVPAVLIQNNNDEYSLGESCTILRHLSDIFEVDNKWYPRDNLKRRAMIDQWLDWHHTNTRYSMSSYVFGQLFLKNMQKAGMKSKNEKAQDTTPLISKILTFLDNIFSKRKFIVDDEISIADLIIACEINQLIMTEYNLSNFKNVVIYLNRINSIEEVKMVNEVFEGIMGKLKMKLNKPKF